MKYLTTDLYMEFECVGGECPDTCCAGWEIIVDKETYTQYSALASPLREKILPHIEKNADGLHVIKMNENGRCPMLDENGLCSIYRWISPDAMCITCQTYPRKIQQYYDVFFLTVSLSCPEVSRTLLEGKDRMGFPYMEDEEQAETEGADWARYNELINGLVIKVEILQDRDIPLWKRIQLVLDLAEKMQTYFNNGELAKIRSGISCYKDKRWRLEQMENGDEGIPHLGHKGAFLNKLLHIVEIEKGKCLIDRILQVDFSVDESQIEEWMEIFDHTERDDTEYEKIAVQLIFEYYMDALKGKPLDRSAFKILVYLILLYGLEMYWTHIEGQLGLRDRVLLISRLSRFLEHSEALDEIVDKLLRENGRIKLYGMLDFLD